jgi:DNA-binding transcriptional LysR family regulator
MPGLPEFRRLHPHIDLVCNPVARTSNPAHHEADLALQTTAPDSKRVFARSAGRLACALYASHGYIRVYGPPVDRDDVLRRPLLGYETALSTVAEYSWLDAPAPGKRVVLRVVDTRTLAEAVRAGLGLAVLPCMVGDELDLVRVASVPVAIERLWVVAPREQRAAAGVREVADLLVEVLQRHADALRGRAS